MTGLFRFLFLLLTGLLLASLSFTGCSTLHNSSSSADGQQSSSAMPPYFPSGVNDVQIPAELELNRDDTMFINTSSYNGGILSFEGRVDTDSVADFFLTTMQKNGWKKAGSIRYKNILMAFFKPNKSCIIKIIDTGLAYKTKVYIYYTDDMETQAPPPYHSGNKGLR